MSSGMSIAGVEQFTAGERELLGRYFTNLEGPVFALVNLPEVVKGALVRALLALAQEPAPALPGRVRRRARRGRGHRASTPRLVCDAPRSSTPRVFSEYGDDSVAQLGGVHLACEQSSNVLTKILERGRLMSYLEQSTRYIPYDSRLPSGHYRYHRDPAVLDFAARRPLCGRDGPHVRHLRGAAAGAAVFRRASEPEARGVSELAHRQAVRAAASTPCGACSPRARSRTSGSSDRGRAMSSCCCGCGRTLFLRPARYADLMLVELRKVIPSFLSRIDGPERGGVWTDIWRPAAKPWTTLVHELWPR